MPMFITGGAEPLTISCNRHRKIPEPESMSEPQSSDAMKNLVKFLVCLAILGDILALAVWYITGNPGLLHTPLNAYPTALNDQVT